MIQIKYGNLLDAEGVIVQGCNAQGVMGSGIALQIKNKWPECYNVYKHAIKEWNEQKINPLGRFIWYWVSEEKIIINAITQEFYGQDKNKIYVDYEAMRKCFETINFYFKGEDLPINFPLIGCGLANGDWKTVSTIIDEELDDSLTKILWIKE